jgi:hypothetical protein
LPVPNFLMVEVTFVMPESRPATGCSRPGGTVKVSAPPVLSVVSLASMAWLIGAMHFGVVVESPCR